MRTYPPPLSPAGCVGILNGREERNKVINLFMSENKQNKKRAPGKGGYGRRVRESGEFRIGSRDILATPEILSPFDYQETPTDTTGKSRRNKKNANTEAVVAPVHNRKGRKKGAEGREAVAESSHTGLGKNTTPKNSNTAAGKKADKGASKKMSKGASKSTLISNGKSTGKNAEKAPVTFHEQAPAAQSSQPVQANQKPARSRNRRGGPTIVSAEESIVVSAKTMSTTPDRRDASSGKNRPAGLPTVPGAKLRVIPLGGLNEVGKNMTVMEYGDDIIIIDCGIGFPDEDEMPGIDLVVPDTTYLETNRNRIRGMVITHGHEDHVGAIPYILQKLDIPIYGTRLALGIIENKLQEHTLPWKADLRCVKAGDVIKLGASFTVEFIRVNHSIADACALAINTPLGMVIHSGDFKLDLTPIDGDMMDITRLGELGRAGVLLLMCESTNAERPGYTPSETKVGRSLEVIFTMHKDRRIVISTFSSNVHRVQQIINISARHGRKVAVTGRSMINIVSAAVELGYMTVPEGVLIDINDIKRYKPEELTLITTGSQGEPMSALYRMAFGEHSQVSLGWGDLVVLSASAIPGNEKLVGRIVNELSKMGVTVINDASVEVHVSGHACQEELKLMQGLTRPRYFMPVHGEYKHMAANRDLAVAMGVPESHVFISDIGKVLEIDEKGARWAGTVPSGVVLIDGLGVGDVGNIVLRDRKHLSQDGLIVVVAAVDAASGLRVAGPDIMSRGFVYVRESEELMEEIRRIAVDAIDISLRRSGRDWFEIKNTVKDDITKFLYARTGRRPMVLPIIMDV